MADDVFSWHWQGRDVALPMRRAGAGPKLLLVPAPSSISTREEMHPLQTLLAERFETLAPDLPGFGAAPKAAMAWNPAAYRAFLADLVRAENPYATVAAGHMAGYLLRQAVHAPGSAGKIALIAPTWRGPLPTMLGRRPRWLERIARAADTPVLGAALYRLNVNRWTVGLMARGHVYADRHWLNAERLAQKLAVTNAPGARHASVRFVCGALDPLTSREEFLSLAAQLTEDALVIYGAATPRRSLAEMRALDGLPHIRVVKIDGAKLAVHEERPAETVAALAEFLAAPG